MKKRAFLLIIFAAMLGVLAVALVRGLINQQMANAPAADGTELTTVVVATQPLYFGDLVAEERLKIVQWPQAYRPQGAFSSIEEILGDGSEERVALKTVAAGEPVLGNRISGFGERAALSARIDRDMRATTIRVDDVKGVAGFVLPGDRVDVLLTRGSRNDQSTTTILQNVRVLAVDQQAAEDKNQPAVARAVTIEVTPEQSQKIALANMVGTLSLALRNEANIAAAPVPVISIADLYPSPGPQAKVAEGSEAPKHFKVRVLSGRKEGVELSEHDINFSLRRVYGTGAREEADSKPDTNEDDGTASDPRSGQGGGADRSIQSKPLSKAEAQAPRHVAVN